MSQQTLAQGGPSFRIVGLSAQTERQQVAQSNGPDMLPIQS